MLQPLKTPTALKAERRFLVHCTILVSTDRLKIKLAISYYLPQSVAGLSVVGLRIKAFSLIPNPVVTMRFHILL